MPNEPYDPNTSSVEPNSAAPSSFGTVPSAATSTGMAPNTAAGLSGIFTLITGIVFLLIEKRNTFVRFWAMQATVFGLTGLAISVVFRILATVFSFSSILLTLLSLVSLLVSLALFVAWIVMLVKAFSGKEWELPFLGKIARQQLQRFPAS